MNALIIIMQFAYIKVTHKRREKCVGVALGPRRSSSLDTLPTGSNGSENPLYAAGLLLI
jgi:hypothetical protein